MRNDYLSPGFPLTVLPSFFTNTPLISQHHHHPLYLRRRHREVQFRYHANVADSQSQTTTYRLRSNLHRVVVPSVVVYWCCPQPSPPPLTDQRWLEVSRKNLGMGISKTEINLRRLITAAPQQQNQAKLIHYVATLRELLEQLTEETTPEGLPRVSKAKLNDYSEKIESIAANIVSPVEIFEETSAEASPERVEEVKVASPPGLRKRPVPSSFVEHRSRDDAGTDSSPLVKLDTAAQSHIEKHRKLQEDLTDEMVGMARQLKESSLMMSQSLQNAEKILDSTEKAVEHSLASTTHANVRAMSVFSQSSKTSCFTWLIMLVMLMAFMMVVFLIRIT